jgi:hypothetical protein
VAGQRGAGGRFVGGGGGGGGAKPKLSTKFDLIGDWEKALRVTRSLSLDTAINRAVKQEAALAVRIIKQNLQRGGAPAGAPFAALSLWTVASRRLAKPPIRGSKPLMARADLYDAITYVVMEDNKRETTAFVGVLKQAKSSSPGGAPLVNIGMVQEFGKTIVVRITPKMQRFLGVLAKQLGKGPKPGGSKGGKRFLVIRIPPRPFIRPAYDVWVKDAQQRMAKRIAMLTGGKLGTP